MENKKYIPIINRSEASKVFVDSVLMIEQELRKIIIYTDDDRYSRYGKIDELSIYLDDRFFKCHQSYFINLDKVVKMREQTIYFENGVQIMLGREKFHAAKQRFSFYMSQALLY